MPRAAPLTQLDTGAVMKSKTFRHVHMCRCSLLCGTALMLEMKCLWSQAPFLSRARRVAATRVSVSLLVLGFYEATTPTEISLPLEGQFERHESKVSGLTSALRHVSSSHHLGNLPSFRSGTELAGHLSLFILIGSSWTQNAASLLPVIKRPHSAAH